VRKKELRSPFSRREKGGTSGVKESSIILVALYRRGLGDFVAELLLTVERKKRIQKQGTF